MKSIIVYPTALEFWMHFYSDKPLNRTALSGKIAFNRTALENAADKFNLTFPIHIAVPKSYNRSPVSKFIYHTLPEGIPQNSYIYLGNDVYICSPELCFIQAAANNNILQTLVIANDLCASYCIDEQAQYGQRERRPITDVARIQKYLENVANISGTKLANITINYAVDNSFSPFESKIAAIGVLPIRYGGFGLPKPFLNYDIKLPPLAANYLRKESCCCDQVWPKSKLILEYDSTMTHLTKNQHYYDKKKSTALNQAGYKLFTVTAEQFDSFSAFNNLFLMLRNDLGLRNREERFSKTEEKRRQNFRQLFGKKDFMY